MVHEHLRSLRLDRRVLRRRNWISPAELQNELAGLPDATTKIEEPAAEPSGEAGASAETASK